MVLVGSVAPQKHLVTELSKYQSNNVLDKESKDLKVLVCQINSEVKQAFDCSGEINLKDCESNNEHFHIAWVYLSPPFWSPKSDAN